MIAVLVSGGKDSAATLLVALERFPKEKVIPVFTDTGWESRYTYAYLNYLEAKLGIQIVRKLRGGVGDDKSLRARI